MLCHLPLPLSVVWVTATGCVCTVVLTDLALSLVFVSRSPWETGSQASDRTESRQLTTPTTFEPNSTIRRALWLWLNHKTNFVFVWQTALSTSSKKSKQKANRWYSSKNIQYICCINLYRMPWTFSYICYTLGSKQGHFLILHDLQKMSPIQPQLMHIFTNIPNKTALGCTWGGQDDIQTPYKKKSLNRFLIEVRTHESNSLPFIFSHIKTSFICSKMRLAKTRTANYTLCLL